MRIEPYTPGDEHAILALFKKCFRYEMSLAFWQWRFQQNPAGRERISLMWDGDVLAGHYAVSPLRMLVEGKEVLAALSMTTMTHPDYAGKGIFTSLADELYARIQKEQGIHAVWGFPNNNSHYGLVKKLAWKNIGVLPTFSLSTDKLRGEDGAAISAGPLHFTAEHEEAFRSLLQQEISTLRDARYLNWRYGQNPINSYTLFELQAGGLRYFAVCKLYQPPGQAPEVDVVELQFPAEAALLQALFARIKTHYQQHAPSRFNLWLPLDDPNHLLLERLGFVNSLPLTYWGIRDLSGSVAGGTDLRRWNFSLGDSDLY